MTLRTLRSALVPALTVLIAGALTACGSSGSDGGGGGASTSSSSSKHYTIGIDLSQPDDPFFVEMAQGIRDEAKRLRVKTILTYSNYDASKQIDDVQDLVTKNVDGILISPADVKA